MFNFFSRNPWKKVFWIVYGLMVIWVVFSSFTPLEFRFNTLGLFLRIPLLGTILLYSLPFLSPLAILLSLMVIIGYYRGRNEKKIILDMRTLLYGILSLVFIFIASVGNVVNFFTSGLIIIAIITSIYSFSYAMIKKNKQS